MRYVVTGAAGFIGSHLCRGAARRRARGGRLRLLHRLLRPGAEGGERARPRRPPRRPRRGPARLRGLRRRLPPRGPARGAQLRRRLRALPAAQRARVAARLRGGGARRRKVVFASSSSVYGAAERYPTPEDTPPRPLSPYGITKLACEHLADAYGREFGLDCVVAPVLQRVRAAPASRHGVHADRRSRSPTGGAFELYGDGDAVARLDLRRRHRRRHDRSRWSAAAAPTTSAAARGVDERDDRAARARSPGARSTCARRRRPFPATSGARRPTRRGSAAELGWEPPVSLEDGLTRQWEWASARVARR